MTASLNWLEEYTNVPYPFAKYDFIILPGFQYGGMEHTGATLYNDTQMFLSENPTPDEELRRTQLIAPRNRPHVVRRFSNDELV